MKKIFIKRTFFCILIVTTALMSLTLAGCGQKAEKENKNGMQNQNETDEKNGTDPEGSEVTASAELTYAQITQEEAKELLDTETDYVLLDVRSKEEYDAGHIPGAVVLPHDQIRDLAAKELPDTDRLILVYCRSGNRSRIAAQELAEMGYTNVKEFGGINTWPYDTEK